MWEPDPVWHAVTGGTGTSTVGVWRTERDGQPLVVKRLAAPGPHDPPEYSEPHHFAYWRREADVALTGVTVRSPGLRATPTDVAEDDDLHWKALLRHFRPSKPLIAAVEGWALAGGTEILQGTELRVAGESATFGLTEVARGLFPLGGSTTRLPRQIAYTHAAEILLTGRHVSAQEALEIGLIGHVVPDGQAMAKALELADVIAACAPLSVQAVLRAMREGLELSEAESLKNDLEHGWPIFATEDAKEGARAFKEKRPANFQGK